MSEIRKKLMARVSPDVHKRVKRAALDRDITLDALIETAVLMYLGDSTISQSAAPQSVPDGAANLTPAESRLIRLVRNPEDPVQEEFAEMCLRVANRVFAGR